MKERFIYLGDWGEVRFDTKH